MKARTGGWIQTFTGRKFWPMDPAVQDVDARDIAHALSMMCRFNGHVREFYSVAEHSIRVSLECPPEAALWGLLHDAAEAYLVDVPRPVKPFLEGYEAAEQRVMWVIAEKFGLPWPMPEVVHEVDERMLAMEAKALISGPLDDWGFPDGFLDAMPDCQSLRRPMDSRAAETLFLRRLNELMRTAVPR